MFWFLARRRCRSTSSIICLPVWGRETRRCIRDRMARTTSPATNETNLTAVNPGFVNAASLNCQLTSGSAAINAGTNPALINGFNLTPTNEYVAVANTEARPVEGSLDIGAYEFVPAGNQPPTAATAAAASSATVTGTTVNLSVLGADVSGEANLTYSWAVASGPTGVTFSSNDTNTAQNTTATFTQSGSYTFRATITAPGDLSVTSTTATVTVVQTPTALSLSPTTATVVDRATKQFAATVTDQFGMAISNPAVTWTSSGLGSVSTTGLYAAPASGTGSAMVTATSGASAAKTAVVTIIISKASPRVSLAFSSSSAVFGQAVTFVATVTGSGAIPTGTVTFYDDGTVLGTVPLNGSGMAELTTTALTLNGNSISASYSGAVNFIGASSGASTEFVTSAATQIVFATQEFLKKKQLVSVDMSTDIQPVARGAGVPTGI